MSATRRSVEARGKNVEDAIQKGLAQLGVRRDQVEIYIITEGSRGILGIGAEDARVRLTVLAPPEPPPPPSPPPPVAEAPRPTPPPVASPPVAPVLSSPVLSVPPPPPLVAPDPLVQPRTEPEGFLSLPPSAETPVASAPPAASAPPTPPVAASVQASQPPAAIEALAAETVGEILTRMGYRVRVTSRQSPPEEGDDGPAYMVDVRGGDLNSLLGRRGEPLDALQYLTRLAVQHKTGEWASIIVDVEGYRERRAVALRNLAQQMADRVKRDGRSISLEPMPPYERRIVHLTLRDNPAVMTLSVGEGETRKVTIRPKK